MKKSLVLIPALLLAVLAHPARVAAQDIHFSQFYENAILRNPALTGIFSGDYKAGVNFRSQWSNVATPFVTTMASAESRIRVSKEVNDYFSFGLAASYDRAGSISFNSLQIYPAINYNKAIEDRHMSFLSFGFAGGYIQRSVDPSRMTFSNQYVNGSFNATNATGETMVFNQIKHFDLSAGVSFNSSLGAENQVNYFLGAAAYHLTRPRQNFGNESFIRLNTKWTGQLGVRARLSERLGLTVHVDYANQQPYQELIGGGMITYRNYDAEKKMSYGISAGMFYRHKDALIPTVKFDFGQYAVTASYDMNNSSLKPASGGVGGWEISLYTRGIINRGVWAGDQLRCPRFENMLPAYDY